jgi:tRNA dimethylallyltransferase
VERDPVQAARKKRLLAVIGPTAVGKTELSLALADALNAEIISVDSRQVYRYLDVGTDKVSPALRRETPHHLIDVADPDETFSAAKFAEMASDAVSRIAARGREPLFVGGSPFYYDALFNSVLTQGLPRDPEVRRGYEALAETEGASALHDRLAAVDPASAARLHVNDVRRVSRALELHDLTGMAPSALYASNGRAPCPWDVLYIGLNCDRSLLFKRIEARVRAQFHAGYLEEVEWLLKQGYDERYPSMQGFGYRELTAVFRGQLSFDEAMEGDIRGTKAFCRRQMTWFGKFPQVVWYDTQGQSAATLEKTVCSRALEHLESAFSASSR